MLTEVNNLNEAQQRQVQKQIELHTRCVRPFVFPPVELGDGVSLDDVLIYPGVLWPMSSRRLAAFLYSRRKSLRGKTIIDMGCGCGLQGLIAALYGAERVILSDITEEAYRNTLANVKRYELTSKCEVRRGNLFECVPEAADIIVFAQPYFAGKPDPTLPFTYGMLDEGELILRFLEQARRHIKEKIVMCHLDLAGDTNNPRIHAPTYGYTVIEHGPELLTSGEQQGLFSVQELSLP